jgi:YVTN family beta-propeller protein
LVLFLAVLTFHPPGVLRAATSLGPRQSSPIAITDNDRFVVAVNPEAHTITLFRVAPGSGVLSKLREIPVGREPSSLALHPDGLTVYVANAFDGTVSVVDLSEGGVTDTFGVGAEPVAVALSPNGTRLYVASSASNALVVVNTDTLEIVAAVDLSPFGTAPRAIAVTNDGDRVDSDETVYVALFFGQPRAGRSTVQEGQDDQREGRVVALSAATNFFLDASSPISLGPLANTGFNSNGRLAPAGPGLTPAVASTNPQTFTTPTGAFPNQLAAIALHPTLARAYVVSTGASPNGPFRFNSNTQGLVSVFDTATRLEVTAGQSGPSFRRTAPLNLNQGINLDTALVPRLFMSNPVAMAWRPNGADAWVVIQNSNLVVRLNIDGAGIPSIGAPLAAGPGSIVRVDLENVAGELIPGRAPQGIAINNNGSRAYVFNFISRSVTTLDLTNPTAPTIIGTAQSARLPTRGTAEAFAHLGAELFFTGRGPQERMASESWGGCIVCHPNGRADSITWMFPAGPRQTIPLDGMFNKQNPADQRILNWSALRDENHDFELNTRNVFGGRGLIDDDRLFLALGGANGGLPTDTGITEQFQQVTGGVGLLNDLAGGVPLPTLAAFTNRRDHAAATLDDDRVFILGGRTGPSFGSLVGAADAVLELNPRTNVLRRRSSAGFTPRHSLGAAAVRTSLGPRIYAIGGYTSTSSAAVPTNLVQEYNPSTDTWRTVASLPTAVAQFGITVAGGGNTAEPLQLIHVVSGNTASEGNASVAHPNPVQRFQADPSGPGTWTGFNPSGLTLRRNHGAATALRGASSRVFVIGGQNAAGALLGSVEEYQAQAVTLVATPHTPLPAPRARFGIASAQSGNQIYVAGGIEGLGVDQTSILELTVAANPAAPGVPGPAGTPSGNWVTRGNLLVARRGLQLSSPPGVTNFLPARNGGRDPRQDAIAVWIARNVRSSRAPVDALEPAAVRGRQLFGQVGLVQSGFSCATCHGGAKWTRSTVDFAAPPSPETGLGLGNERVIGAELRQTLTQGANVLLNVGTFTLAGGRQNEIRFNAADISQAVAPLGAAGFNIPSLLSVHETAPYFYNGLAQTLAEVLDGTHDTNGGVRHHFVADPFRRADLIAFLRSIDQTTPVFP